MSDDLNTTLDRLIEANPITAKQLAEVERKYRIEADAEIAKLAERGITRAMLREVHVLGRMPGDMGRQGWKRAIEIGLVPEPNSFGGPASREDGAPWRWWATITVVGFDEFCELCILEPDEPQGKESGA